MLLRRLELSAPSQNVDREQDRIVLKVDESSNTKITFTLASINRVLTDSDDEKAASAGA